MPWTTFTAISTASVLMAQLLKNCTTFWVSDDMTKIRRKTARFTLRQPAGKNKK
jgi:hypothetical protein